MKRLLLIAFFLTALPSLAWAHPGGLDSNQCHTCWSNCEEKYDIPTGDYHCHASGDDSVYTPRPITTLDDIKNHQSQTAIEYLLQQEIISGYPDGSYRPDQLVNRAELVKIIVEAS